MLNVIRIWNTRVIPTNSIIFTKLREGNVSTRVDLRGGGLPLSSMNHWSRDQGVCLLVGLPPGESADPISRECMGYNGIQSTSGRHASYLNDFLFKIDFNFYVRSHSTSIFISQRCSKMLIYCLYLKSCDLLHFE